MVERTARPRPAAPIKGSARRIAQKVLVAVDDDDAYANLLLPTLLRGSSLDAADRALATELTYGTLRALGLVDSVLAASSTRRLPSLDTPVRAALRLGVYQLLFTRVPDHAAVTTAVDLVDRRAAGFTNGVLRSVGRRWEAAGRELAVLLAGGAEELDPLDRLALEHSHPRWIAEAFLEALHGDLAEVEAALRADNERPGVTLVARRIDPAALAAEVVAAGLTAEPGRWSPLALRLTGGDPSSVPAVRAGLAGIQGEGSQLIALALAAAAPGAGVTLDLCAGPGGKAAALAVLLPDADLVAVERFAHRAALVRTVLGADARAVVRTGDGRQPPVPPGGAARVLVDAPCSGLGALRRRPEARWRRSPEDLEALVPLQHELLAAAIEAVEPGGVVAYATCSPHRAETLDIVEAALAAGLVEAVDARAYLPGVPDLGPGPHVQLWPHRHGTDAMFLALLRRKDPS